MSDETGAAVSREPRKVAVVTGAAQGIGAATVSRLAADGFRIVALDLDEARAQEVMEAGGLDGVALRCDVSQRPDVDAAFDAVVERFGRIDVLVNNAGVTRDNLLFKMSDDDWDAVIATHLTGGFYCARAAQGVMVQQRSGRIIFVSSRSALGNRGQANYSAAKAGVQGMARTLAIELGPFGVTVNAVAPGFIETAMTRAIAERTERSWEDVRHAAAQRVALCRTGQPSEIAGVISFLAGDGSSFVTGQVIYATGHPTG